MATSRSSHSRVKTHSTRPPWITRSAGSSPRATASLLGRSAAATSGMIADGPRYGCRSEWTAGASALRVRFERRLTQPRWLSVAVPAGSLVFAFVIAGIVLLVTGHDPFSTYRQLFDAAFLQTGSLSQTLVTTTPL